VLCGRASGTNTQVQRVDHPLALPAVSACHVNPNCNPNPNQPILLNLKPLRKGRRYVSKASGKCMVERVNGQSVDVILEDEFDVAGFAGQWRCTEWTRSAEPKAAVWNWN